MSEVCKPQSGTIYTRDEAMLIVEMFEDVLDTYNIKVPSPEDDEREPDNEAKLYGSVYSICWIMLRSPSSNCSTGVRNTQQS